ncbi:hypothetical protein [Spelaeicoccus albus]|uniref:Uncharacterized protein n=1 Tax=Spelaeicoccus albus TaxID=1280376 RepID=A0A7Z0IHT6_9MICO|nr:hypothetical protein [Spelaeicoccus albus]NYI67968.1 hypothetical protein [Spelaeicoccus albus]
MRWEDLFADLEARWDSALRSETEAELPEVIRAERAQSTIDARLTGCVGRHVRIGAAGRALSGRLSRIGTGWTALQGADNCAIVINTRAIDYLDGLGLPQAPGDPVTSRLSFGHALRSIAKDRAAVRVVLRTAEMTGTIDRVGADHVDLALHDLDQPRRSGRIRGVRTVPLAAIAFVAGR